MPGTEAGVQQEVSSKSLGSRYPKPSTDKRQVVITRTYHRTFVLSEA